MRKNKVECDVFYYKGNYLIEQPAETKVYNRQYIEGVGLVAYCKRKTVYIEILCVIIIIVNTLSLMFYPAMQSTVYVPESFNYYNDSLYTNIVSDDNHKSLVTVVIFNNKYLVEPGDRLYKISMDNPPDKIDVIIKTKFLFFNKEKKCTIPVHTVY